MSTEAEKVEVTQADREAFIAMIERTTTYGDPDGPEAADLLTRLSGKNDGETK